MAITKDTQALLARLQRQGDAIERRKYARLSITPNVMGGRVCINGTRLSAPWVAGRFFAGESVGEIARDYEQPQLAIEQLIRLMSNARIQRRSPEVVFQQWRKTQEAAR